jgi:hypothetical protein
MIAQRFRPVAWVIGCAVAATALYTVSLRVASERARLDNIDYKIASTRRDIRQLQTEMGTRASLRQLERWNGESLSLSAPHANQFLPNETQISRIDGATRPIDSFAPPPVMVQAAKTPKDEGAAAATAADQIAAKDRMALLENTPPAQRKAAALSDPNTVSGTDQPNTKKTAQ